ncbi:unnamed protein product, partial [Discosporangium mesarthrocarpum]
MTGAKRAEGDEFLEGYYDAIVLSTGLASSMVAAALAKAGKTVLHIDRNSFYGDDYASFSFLQLLDWAKDAKDTSSMGAVEELAVDLDAVKVNIARAFAEHEIKHHRATDEAEEKHSDQEVLEEDEKEEIKGSPGDEGMGHAPAAMDDKDADEGRPQGKPEPPNGGDVIEDDAYASRGNVDGEGKATQEDQRHRIEEASARHLEAFRNAAIVGLTPKRSDLEIIGLSSECSHELEVCTSAGSSLTPHPPAGSALASYRRAKPTHPAWDGRGVRKEHSGDGPEAIVAGAEERLHPAFLGYRTGKSALLADLVENSRSFSLDLTSQLVLASGEGVDALVNSGVARYLEFKDGDVFRTRMLSPAEKRVLMKFLQFASDRGMRDAGEDVLSRNERALGQGRSLMRPQNREAAYDDFGYDGYRGGGEGVLFEEFLERCGLPERVRDLVKHALALLTGRAVWEASTKEGLDAVYR